MPSVEQLNLRLIRGATLLSVSEWVTLSAPQSTPDHLAGLNHPLRLTGCAPESVDEVTALLSATRTHAPGETTQSARNALMDTLYLLSDEALLLNRGQPLTEAPQQLPNVLSWQLPRLHLLIRSAQRWGPGRIREVTLLSHLIRRELSTGAARNLPGDIGSLIQLMRLGDPHSSGQLALPLLGAMPAPQDLPDPPDETAAWILSTAETLLRSVRDSRRHELIGPLLSSNPRLHQRPPLTGQPDQRQKTGTSGGSEEGA